MLVSYNYKINIFKYRRKICETVNIIIASQRWKATSPRSPSTLKLKVLFFGTDTFSLPSLKALHKNYYTNKENASLGIVTSFKNPANCVRTYAELNKLQLYRWPVLPEACRGYDLGVVVSFGHLIPEHIINEFPKGMINLHASLLPRWRGAAPIIYAILNGDTKTGVSIMKIEPRHFDIGDILAQNEVPIKKGIFMSELHSQLATEGADLLVNTIDNYTNCLETARKQNDAFASYAPKITSAITAVNWSLLSAEELHCRFRALFGYKYLSTIFQNKTVHLIDIKLPATHAIPSSLNNTECGRFFYDRYKRCLLVRCAADTYLEVYQLRIEGKKAMSAIDFNNGFLKQKCSTQALSFTS